MLSAVTLPHAGAVSAVPGAFAAVTVWPAVVGVAAVVLAAAAAAGRPGHGALRQPGAQNERGYQ